MEQNIIHTHEQLNIAAEELKALDAEGYLQIIDHIHRLEEQLNGKMTEAAGVAWSDIEVPGIGRISVTARSAISCSDAVEQLLAEAEYLMQRRSQPVAQTTATYASAPASLPQQHGGNQASIPAHGAAEAPAATASDGDFVKMRVSTITHKVGKNGTLHYLNVKTDGYPYQKYGVPAYPEVFPMPINFDGWMPEQERMDVPAGMAWATIDKTKKKVIEFSAA